MPGGDDPIIIIEDDITIIESPVTVAEVVTVSEIVSVILSAGDTGPQGAPGAPGPSGDDIVVVTAAIDLGGHRVVTLDGVGEARYADNTQSTHLHRVLGITLGAFNTGTLGTVMRLGEIIEPTWNWTLNQPIFLGTNGLLTQTPPVSPAVFLQIVGFPILPTSMFVDLRDPISLT